MKTKEELSAMKQKMEYFANQAKELSDEELNFVTGGKAFFFGPIAPVYFGVLPVTTSKYPQGGEKQLVSGFRPGNSQLIIVDNETKTNVGTINPADKDLCAIAPSMGFLGSTNNGGK